MLLSRVPKLADGMLLDSRDGCYLEVEISGTANYKRGYDAVHSHIARHIIELELELPTTLLGSR